MGTLNGRIENSVSYAKVYGVSDVGGLAGMKGQAMGLCEIINSAFLGSIEASGGRVGGIIGAGYINISAPNTMPVTVRNCYVAASISGNTTPIFSNDANDIGDTVEYDHGSGIGGIVGSEIGILVVLDEGYISDNHFYGTITDTNPDAASKYARVGGILGEYGGTKDERMHYENNYYLGSDNYTGFGFQRSQSPYSYGSKLISNPDWKPEEESFIPKTAEAFADGTVTALLNQGAYKNWIQGEESYPVHTDAVIPVSLTISGDYKTEYYIGDELDLTGAVFTVSYSDGTTEIIDASELNITGFDSSQQAVCTVKAEKSPVFVEFTVTVLLPSTGTDSDYITVYFQLLGDREHDSDADGQVHGLAMGGLQVWLPERAYTVDQNILLWDLLLQILEENGISYSNPSGNYIEEMTYNGVTIGEFTNGYYSGWMYTLNGAHPLLGVSEQFLANGDRIIWHYTDDYRLEEGSMGREETDNGSSGSGSGGSGSGNGDTTTVETKTEAVMDVTAEVTDGEAKAAVEAHAVTEALENNENADVLTVNVESEEAESVELTLDAEAVKAVAEAEADLHIETEQGTVKLAADTLSELAEAGGEVAVSVKANEDGSMTLNVTVDGEAADVKVKVELPAAEEGQVLVIVNEDGTEEIIKKSVVEGDTVYAEIPAGATVTVVENSKEFSDVSDGAWYAGAVDFASSHDLFRGVSEDEFAPQSPMTRAMLATVLFRLEDEPEGAVGLKFGDVKDDSWYTDAVAWASENGIVNGTGNGFEPNANISREQIATMLYRYVNYLGIDTGARGDVSKFKDGKEVSSWASDAMAWAVEVGLFMGDDTGSLNPKGDATRAEVATLMERLVGLIVK